MNTLSVGDALGRYELLCPIAKGGMAQVWAARLRGTRGFQKVVAIKTMLSGALDDQRMERMFQQEAELASHIQHPNVAATLELGEERGILYLAMEWVNGEPLRYVLHEAAKHGGMPLQQAVHLIGQACRGLHAAHEASDQRGTPLGIVHRDISPHNVLVTYSGTVKLVDFGVAKAESGSDELTEHGELKGKLAFMSPEQLAGQPLDRRSDIFALGGILYWLLAGQHPFRSDSPAVTRDNIRSAVPPPPPSSCATACSAELDALVLRALEFKPEARFATARELLDALVAAAPDAFDNDADLRLSEYMKQLFGNRAQLRVQQLELAQQMVDRMRAGPAASGSLPAVVLAAPGAAPSERAAVQQAAELKRPASEELLPAKRATLRQVAAGSGLLVLLSMVSWWAVHSSGPVSATVERGSPAALEPAVLEPSAPHHAAKPVPPVMTAPKSSAAAPPAAASPGTPPPSVPARGEQVELEPRAASVEAPPRLARKAAVTRRKAVNAPSLPAPTSSPEPAPARESSEREKKPTKVDIFDLNSLGGRN